VGRGPAHGLRGDPRYGGPAPVKWWQNALTVLFAGVVCGVVYGILFVSLIIFIVEAMK